MLELPSRKKGAYRRRHVPTKEGRCALKANSLVGPPHPKFDSDFRFHHTVIDSFMYLDAFKEVFQLVPATLFSIVGPILLGEFMSRKITRNPVELKHSLSQSHRNSFLFISRLACVQRNFSKDKEENL